MRVEFKRFAALTDMLEEIEKACLEKTIGLESLGIFFNTKDGNNPFLLMYVWGDECD